MLLAAKPQGVAVMAPLGGGTTHTLMKLESPESEVNPRQSVIHYVPYKRDIYMKRNRLNILEATIQAIKSSFKRVDDADTSDLRLAILSSIHDVYYGKKKSKVVLALSSPTDSRKILVKFDMRDSNRDKFHFHTPNSDSFVVNLDCKPTEIPSMGYYNLRLRSETLNVKQAYHEMYDLHNVHGLKTVMTERSTRRAIIKIPCYSPSSAAQIANMGLPATELHLLVDLTASEQAQPEITSGLKCTLVGARFVCMAQADAHQLLYTKEAQFEDHPTYVKRPHNHQQHQKLASPPAVRNSEYASIAQMITNQIEQFLIKSSASAGQSVPFSWSVSHHDQVVFSHRGLDTHTIGQIGEVFVGLAAIRAANGVAPSLWSDMNLVTPAGLEKLLIKAGHTTLLAGLKALYGKTEKKRLPSVKELLTHTAGLPNLASIDADVDLKYLETLLPGPSSVAGLELPKDRESRLARVLSERVHLVANPGEVVEFSSLGYAIVNYCFANLSSTMRKLFDEFGMGATSLSDNTSGSADSRSEYPDDDTYHASNCTVSTTNDLARYIAGIEKSVADPNAHPLLAASLMPEYLATDYGKAGLHSVCAGGMENCTLRIKLKQCKSASHADRVSLVVFFKLGERPGKSSSLLVWIPGLHTGIALSFSASLSDLFGKSHADLGYGKKSSTKTFQAKHLIKSLLQSSSSALALERGACFDIDRVADTAYAATPKLPPSYREYAMRCSQTSESAEGAWEQLLETSSLFKGEGSQFYPLVQASAEVKRTVLGAAPSIQVADEVVFKQLNSIRISKKKLKHGNRTGLFLEDSQSKELTQLMYDKNIKVVLGQAVAEKVGLSVGGFRRVSTHRRGDLSEVVTIHVLPNKVFGVNHRGCIYVSRAAVLDMKAEAESMRESSERLRVQTNQDNVSQKYYFWKSIESNISDKQEKIGAGAGAVVGAGLLGLGVGAIAGASLARPAYYAPPPPYAYYPPPAYPAGYYYGPRHYRRGHPNRYYW